jgi:Antitoxin ParD
MVRKSSQLQIRVSPHQKAVVKALAADLGVSVSEYVLSRILPPTNDELDTRVRNLKAASHRHKYLSDLVLYLSALSSEEFDTAVAVVEFSGLPLLLQNYAAAAVEQEASRRGLSAPSWTQEVDQPLRPHFAWDLRSLRPYLMRVSPPAFKRRNLFVPSPLDSLA